MNDIICSYIEYRKDICGNWQLFGKTEFPVHESSIKNLVDSSSYYPELGGYMNIKCEKNRRLGLVVTKVVSISICNTVKKIFIFDYSKVKKTAST